MNNHLKMVYTPKLLFQGGNDNQPVILCSLPYFQNPNIWIVPGYKWTNLPQLLLGVLSVANYQVEAELIQTLKTLKELCYCFGRPRRARNRLDTNTLRFCKVLEDLWSKVLKPQWKCMWTSTMNYIWEKSHGWLCVEYWKKYVLTYCPIYLWMDAWIGR